jgi:UDP-galactopyranose mutase
MPAQGYHALFLRMLDHPKIDIRLETDFFTNCDAVKRRHTIFTGSIDAYYGYRFGRLPYRSIRFEHFHLPDTGYTQPVGVFNFPSLNIPYTRITEFKHLTGQVHRGSSLTKEHPCWGGDPYYPVPRLENELLYKRYAALAAFDSSVSFVGRLAQYRYYNMDQVVGAALQTSARLLGQTPDIA